MRKTEEEYEKNRRGDEKNRRGAGEKQRRIRKKTWTTRKNTGEERNLPCFLLLHSWSKDIHPVSCNNTSNTSSPVVESKVAGSLGEVKVVKT